MSEDLFTVEDGQGAQALDFNAVLNRFLGQGVISGGGVTSTGGDYAVTVDAVSVYLNGEQHELSATDFDLEIYVDDEHPRKAIIYVDTEGEYVIAPGEPEELQPEDHYRFDCYRPAPPDLSATDGVPLAEIWLSPDDNRVTDVDIRDRRVAAELTVHSIDAETVDVAEIIDGAGVSHTGELASADEVQSDEEIREIINTDTDHGETAPHEYFSGSHTDLTSVETDQHHTRYTDPETRDAVRGSVELSELTADAGSDGQHIEASGTDAVWSDPPNQQASEVASGTITHTGGSSTTALLAGISTDETAKFEMAVGVASDPSWDGDYAYSMDASRQWNDTAGEIDVELTLTWETDPGSGNDLDLAWSAFETSPVVVEGRYMDADAVAAMDGADIAPNAVDVENRLNSPVYSDVSTITGMERGDLVVASGDGASQFGQYIYDGSEWLGPIGTSVDALSELKINATKDWEGYSITGLGEPANDADAARLQEINDHADIADAHHSKTTSSDIDHSDVSNVQSGQHHGRYTDAEAVDAVAGQVMSSPLTGTSIPGGEVLRNFHYVDSGETLTLLRTELVDEDGNVPDGLEIQLYDREADSVLYAGTSYVNTGTMSNPLAEVSGAALLAVRIYNGTEQELAASGAASIMIE